MMENLNKENFWNEIHEKYPKASQAFCEWIDEYKKNNDWDYLFFNTHKASPQSKIRSTKIKFHNIPIAMQLGVFMQYVIEKKEADVFEIEDMSFKGISDLIRKYFATTNQTK